ncbi:MAG: hypothetical protein JWQ09_2369 [Segetibacter sp.]|nr:hypothetical protein [Segetibacter sp.]
MSKNYKILLIPALIVFLLLSTKNIKAQDNRNDTLKVYAFVVDGDTIPGGRLLDVYVRARMPEKWRKYWAEWTRLRNAVYVTYPYAKAAGRVINEINGQLVNVTDKHERKRIIKSREKDLKKEFADKLTNLSVYQGKVLMKLIYRETGNNCYNLIQEYKGGFTAGFWQTVAILFGSNLKQNYDPVEKDKAIEIIVKDVERMYGHRS